MTYVITSGRHFKSERSDGRLNRLIMAESTGALNEFGLLLLPVCKKRTGYQLQQILRDFSVYNARRITVWDRAYIGTRPDERIGFRRDDP